MTVIAKLPDGRIIAKASISPVSRLSAGDIPIVVAVTDVRKVEEVLQWNLNTDPHTNATPTGTKVDGNTVGTTVHVGAGTTISGSVIAIGY